MRAMERWTAPYPAPMNVVSKDTVLEFRELKEMWMLRIFDRRCEYLILPCSL